MRTLILSRRDVADLLDMAGCVAAVEAAFRAHGRGEAASPAVLGLPADGGQFHVKAGTLRIGGRAFFAAKTNGNFPRNPHRHRLPTIQGVVALFDGEDGRLLALIDSIEVTALRTAAATAVAAKHLARPDASVATIVGCGTQGRFQLRALASVRPLVTAFAFDAHAAVAREFARTLGGELGFPIRAVDDLTQAVRESDLCITCTPSTTPILTRDHVCPGTFVAGVGADAEDKWELAPELLAAASVTVDVLEQAATIGDLHHAITAGVLTPESVHAELGAVVAGRKPGRVNATEITVFDSTGMALQDVAAAAAVYLKAIEAGRGLGVDLAESG